jgi:hypothetical protein
MKQGQISYETLIIFGFMVLIVLTALGFYITSRYFERSSITSSKCIFYGGTNCISHAVITNHSYSAIIMELRNGKGFDISNVNITSPLCDGAYQVGQIRNGHTTIAEITECKQLEMGEVVETQIIITYTYRGRIHRELGEFINVAEYI